MRILQITISIALFFGFIHAMNNKIGALPPLGKFTNPFSGFWQNADQVDLKSSQKIILKGLQQKVEVVFDEHYVPHIFAENESDLFYAQGYIVARDRLWQMDIQTRMAEGRLSEFLGEKTLPMDREKRRIGLKHAAENAMKVFQSDETKLILDQFTKGVNDYIHQLKKSDLPLEFKLLDYEPLEWTSERSALLLKLMAERLTSNELDIENTNFVNLLGQENFDLLFPNFVSEQSPIIPAGTLFHQKPNNEIDDNTNQPIISKRPTEKAERNIGSNNWAIAGQKSVSGNPILCNDPHLVLNFPSVWYEMHLVCPTMNVYGVTMPGSPGIIIGFNKDIAWGVTNAGRDVRNWYHIQYKDKTRNEYAYDSSWKTTTKRVEVIKIRGAEDFIDTVVYTHHGPIVYDKTFNSSKDKIDLALSWTAYIPSNELLTFYLLNKSKNYNDYSMAVSHFVCPGQNFVFAHKGGDIAIKQQGLFPNVPINRDKFILDGSIKENDMNHFIPIEYNPSIKNPERNFVSSANQHPTDNTYPYYYSGGDFEYNRNRRINEVLASREKHSVEDMKKLQADEFNYTAFEVLPTLLYTASKKHAQNKYFIALENWNYFNNIESKAAVYYESFWNHLQNLIWDETMNDKAIMAMPDQFITAKLIREHRNIDLFDIKKTDSQLEGIEELIEMAWDSMNLEMNQFSTDSKLPLTWANYKSTDIMHMAKIDAFSERNVQVGGNKNIVNAVGKIWGPSWRMIVELTPKGPKGLGIYPGGQSGNVGSPYYDNYLEQWRTNQYHQLNYCSSKKDLKKKIQVIEFEKR